MKEDSPGCALQCDLLVQRLPGVGERWQHPVVRPDGHRVLRYFCSWSFGWCEDELLVWSQYLRMQLDSQRSVVKCNVTVFLRWTFYECNPDERTGWFIGTSTCCWRWSAEVDALYNLGVQFELGIHGKASTDFVSTESFSCFT